MFRLKSTLKKKAIAELGLENYPNLNKMAKEIQNHENLHGKQFLHNIPNSFFKELITEIPPSSLFILLLTMMEMKNRNKNLLRTG